MKSRDDNSNRAPRWHLALFAKIEWMTWYRGITPRDRLLQQDGSPSVAGHEAWLFQQSDGMHYGAIYTLSQPRLRNIAIERLGARPSEDAVNNVPVIFLARDPDDEDPKQHLRLVGIYAKARVYRKMQQGEFGRDFNLVCKARDAARIPLARRIPFAGLGWYADNPYKYFSSMTPARRPAYAKIIARCRSEFSRKAD